MNPGYAVIGIYAVGSDKPSLMSAQGQVIVFDTPQMACEFLPLLGGGRLTRWSEDGETASWSPPDPQGVNRATVLTGYDPYHLPPGAPVPSEARLREWRHHIHWVQWWTGGDDGMME